MKTITRNTLAAPRAVMLLGAALGLCAPAMTMAKDTATTAVQVSDLNLSTAGGKRELDRRVSQAINEVCPAEGSAQAPRSAARARHRECAQAVRVSVKQQLDERGGRAVAGH
jgi:UrcA family protein